MDANPYLLMSVVLDAICRALSDEHRYRIASQLRKYAELLNEDAKDAEQQRFALNVAALAALADGGLDAAFSTLGAGLPR